MKRLWAWYRQSCSLCNTVLRTVNLLCVFIGLPYFGWQFWIWASDTAPVIEYGQPAITPSAAYHGDTVTAFLPVRKLRDCDGDVRRVLTGQCGHIVVSDTKTSLIKDFDGRLVIPFRVPFEAVPGPCGFRVHTRYYCNPLDRWLERQVYESPVAEFVVRGRE